MLLAVFERRPNWNESRGFYSRVARWLVDGWREGVRGAEHTPTNYELESKALRSLAGFALRLPRAVAVQISAPVVEAVADQRQEVERFVSGLIMKADRNSDDCFWELWQRVGRRDRAFAMGTGTEGRNVVRARSAAYDLSRPLLEGGRQTLAQAGGPCPPHGRTCEQPAGDGAGHACVHGLPRQGRHGSLPGAFEVVGRMVGEGNALRIASDSRVAYNLETLLRPFVYSQPHRIKTDPTAPGGGPEHSGRTGGRRIGVSISDARRLRDAVIGIVRARLR